MASGQEIGPWRLGRRYMVLPACNSSPGQTNVRLKRHTWPIKPCRNVTCGTDGSTVFSNSDAFFPYKQQGPQRTIPPTKGGDESIVKIRTSVLQLSLKPSIQSIVISLPQQVGDAWIRWRNLTNGQVNICVRHNQSIMWGMQTCAVTKIYGAKPLAY